MRVGDFFTLPALIAFVLGVILSTWVMSLVHGARSKVGNA